MTFDFHILSEVGGRPENQDCVGVRQTGGFDCWAIADGLGGHRGGAEAARLAVDTILRAFSDAPACHPDAVRAWLEAADAAISEQQRATPALRSMRSTVVVLAAGRGEAVWGHVGDSRLYYFHSGRLTAQTSDHSVPQALADTGEITRAEIRFHEDRARLLRSLGARQALRPSIPDARPIAGGDAFLLCTDGFWEYVAEDCMQRDLRESRDASDWLERMRRAVLDAATADHDNYSAIAVLVRA